MNKHIKYLVETLYNNFLNESFESSTIKLFYKKAEELIKSKKNPDNLYLILSFENYNYPYYIHSLTNLKEAASEFGFGNFKDEYLWKGNKKISK